MSKKTPPSTRHLHAVPANDAEPTFGAAYERRLPEIERVREEDCAVINFDVQNAIVTALGVVQLVDQLSPALRGLPLDHTLVDALADYASAAAEAHARFLADIPQESSGPLYQTALELRRDLRIDATQLEARGLLRFPDRGPPKGRNGYRNVALELFTWATVLQEAWPRIQGKTALTVEHIAQAKLLGEQLVIAAGTRRQRPPQASDAARIRRQALTLLLKAYDEVRRGVVFLRWHEGDAEKVVPSIYGARKGGRRPRDRDEVSSRSV